MATTAETGRPDVEDVFTLTPLQQGMLSYALGGLHAFQERSVISLGGRLNQVAFAAAWQAVVDRHAALRTAFEWEKVRVPHQVVFRRAALGVRLVDCRGLDGTSEERLPARLLAAPADTRLDKPPLMTLHFVRAGESRFHVVWTISHLVTDAVSFSVVVDDVLQRYRRALAGRPWDVRRAPSFRAYVAWLKRQDATRAAAEWDREVGARAVPPRTPIAAGGAPAPRRTTRAMTLDAGLSVALESIALVRRTSPFAVYLGSWAIVQGALTGTPSPVVAIVTSCRSLPVAGLDSMVGPVMNAVPVRIDVSEDEAVGAWLRRLGDEIARQLGVEHVPFQRLQDACTARGLRVEVAFNYLNVNRRGMRGAGFAVTGYRQALRSNFPIGVDVMPGTPAGTEIDVSCEASPAVTAAVERMLSHWREVLARIPSHAGTVGALAREASRATAAARAAEVAGRRRRSLPAWLHA